MIEKHFKMSLAKSSFSYLLVSTEVAINFLCDLLTFFPFSKATTKRIHKESQLDGKAYKKPRHQMHD